MSHNSETKQAWVITVARQSKDMPLVILHQHPNLMKYVMSFEEGNVTTQQFLFGGSIKTTADLDSSLMLDKMVMDHPEFAEKPQSEFSTPYMFPSKIEAEEARDHLLDNQEIYRKGLLVEYLEGNNPTNLEVVNVYDLYEELPKAEPIEGSDKELIFKP